MFAFCILQICKLVRCKALKGTKAQSAAILSYKAIYFD